MQSQVSELSPVLVEVKVQVPWERVQKDLDATYRELGRTAKVRGFRPGKVPPNVIKQLYGKQVRAQVSGSLIEQGLMHAVQEHEIAIVAQPEVEPGAVKKGEPFSFTAKVEVRPRIDSIDTKGLTLFRPPVDVEDDAVNAEVERLRLEHADIQVPDPARPAKDGDVLTLDYTVSVDGEPQPDLAAQDRQVELDNPALMVELRDGLTGVKPGETKDVTVPFPEDHDNPKLAGKDALFSVTVKEIHERLLPELDDEFAKDCGDFETLLELRLKIREHLEDGAKRQGEASLRESAITALIAQNEVPVPDAMVAEQRQAMLYEMMQFAQMTGQPFSPQMMEGIDERATRRVKAAILLGALAKQHELRVEDSDVDAKLAEIAEQSGKHVAKVRSEYQGQARQQLESQLLEDKIMAHLLKEATVKDGHPPTEEPKATKKAAPKKKSAAKKKASTKKKAPAKKKAGTATKKKSTAKKKAAPKKKTTKKKA